MNVKWRRMMAVESPVLTKPFWLLAGLAALGLLLSAYREVAGLGAASGLNDGYSWGMFKNFNVTTLTALGSGGFALGVLTFALNRRKYHTLMRTGLLTSILCYTAGMIVLAVDVGRPWNLLMMGNPFLWNPHSILFEVALCMTAYVMIALDFENLAPVLDRFEEPPFPPMVRGLATDAKRIVKAIYPYGLSLALTLPAMHQSSLGSLMLQSGPRVHPTWQTPWLPGLYLIMAFVLGLAFVDVVLMASCAVWKLPMDRQLLASLTEVVSWLAIVWLAVRFGDLIGRGQLGAALHLDYYGILFVAETLLIAVPAILLLREGTRLNPASSFVLLVALSIGGMVYRYAPTTLAFMPGPGYRYFPSVVELLISIGFISLAVVGYLFTVKQFPILPATLEMSLKANGNGAHISTNHTLTNHAPTNHAPKEQAA
jgi:Ni/Fe-hydrogenase subunit HybB-like protein